MKELQRHLDAFELYFKYKQSGHNTKEAISLVNVECGFSETSLYKWKREFDWDGREAIRSAEINKKVQQRTDSTITENKVKYLSFYHKLLDNLKKDFKITINNPRDLDLVVKGALLLQGEATEHIKSEGEHNVRFSRKGQERILNEEGYN